MTKKRRVETLTETHEVFVLRRLDGQAPTLCAECGAGRSAMLLPEEAATLTGTTLRAVYRFVETGRVHFTETADGAVLVCLASLPARRSLETGHVTEEGEEGHVAD